MESVEQHNVEQSDCARMISMLIRYGWVCVAASALFLTCSIFTVEPDGGIGMGMAVCLTLARICGIGGFVIGLIAIFNRRWNQGTPLILLSIGLPFVSFIFHGTI